MRPPGSSQLGALREGRMAPGHPDPVRWGVDGPRRAAGADLIDGADRDGERRSGERRRREPSRGRGVAARWRARASDDGTVGESPAQSRGTTEGDRAGREQGSNGGGGGTGRRTGRKGRMVAGRARAGRVLRHGAGARNDGPGERGMRGRHTMHRGAQGGTVGATSTVPERPVLGSPRPGFAPGHGPSTEQAQHGGDAEVWGRRGVSQPC